MRGLSMNRIKKLREEKKITQEELAFQLETSQQRISKLENQQVLMTEDFIIRCAEYFGVSTDYLLGVSDIKFDIDFGQGKMEHADINNIRRLLYYYDSFGPVEQEMIMEFEKVISKLYYKKTSSD